MVVDGSVVMIENIVRHLSLKMTAESAHSKDSRCRAHEVTAAGLLFAPAAYIWLLICPSLHCRPSRDAWFKAMAWTVTFALIGSRSCFAFLVAPVIGGIAFKKGAKEWRNPPMMEGSPTH